MTLKQIFKQTLLLALTGVLAFGCASSGNHQQEKDNQKLVENARVNVDWPGTYQGMLPCSGACEGIATMIVLFPNNDFTLRTRKIGIDIKDKIDEGKTNWLASGSELTLIGDNPMPVAIKYVRVNRDSLTLHLQPLTAGAQPLSVQLDKTGPIPIPPPTI